MPAKITLGRFSPSSRFIRIAVPVTRADFHDCDDRQRRLFVAHAIEFGIELAATRHMERAKAFYQNTFQVTLENLQSPSELSGLELWAFPPTPETPGCSGALVKMPGKDSGIGGTIVYFSCVDCATEAAQALQNGGSIQREKFSIGQYGYIALVVDTEGNMIGLHSMA